MDDIIKERFLFAYSTKVQKISTDRTFTRLTSLQNFLLTLLKRGEISNSEYNSLKPKSAHFCRAHGLPKIHKRYSSLSQFRPVIDTTNTPHHNIAQFLSNLLNPLTQNEFSLSDSFQAAADIRSISKCLFLEGYKFVSFDVVSLFTDVPLNKTVKIILARIYYEN